MAVEGQLKRRELDILNILFNAEQDLTSYEISCGMEGLTQSTVTQVTNNFLREGIIEVADIKHSGKVFSRTFKPTEKAKEVLLNHMISNYKYTNNIISKSEACKAILEVEQSPAELKQQIKELKAIIKKLEYKEKNEL